MSQRARLIRLDGHVLEVVSESPAGSLFLLNRSGLLRRKILRLESELESARAELAALEAEAGGDDVRGQM